MKNKKKPLQIMKSYKPGTIVENYNQSRTFLIIKEYKQFYSGYDLIDLETFGYIENTSFTVDGYHILYESDE